jgi:uncharacterized membrane protein required for colicin V production
MTGLCTAVSSSGFWQGLWDGITAPVSLIMSIFFNVSFYDVCARSWWYNCMFLIGVAVAIACGALSPEISAIAFVICLMAFVIWFIFANILYILGFLALCVVAAVLWQYVPVRSASSPELDE